MFKDYVLRNVMQSVGMYSDAVCVGTLLIVVAVIAGIVAMRKVVICPGRR